MEKVVCALASGFSGRGWSVRAIFPRLPDSARLLDWCRAQGVAAEASLDLLDLAAPHGLVAMRALGRLVRDSRADVVNIHFGSSFLSLKDVIAARVLGGARCFATIHGAEVITGNKRLMSRLASHLVNGTVGVSRAVCERLLQMGAPSRRVLRVPNGVRSPRLMARDTARAELELPLDAFVIATACRLVAGKGIDALIDALRVLEPGAVLAVAGDGPLKLALEQRAAQLDRNVRLLGFLAPDRIDALYAAADVLALPSLEGFGLVYAEAAQHGVPSIGLDAGGAKDAIEHGVTGLLIPPGDRAALESALSRLQGDPELVRRLGAGARLKATRDFSQDAMVDGYERLFLGDAG